jgi:hypothetical protein
MVHTPWSACAFICIEYIGVVSVYMVYNCVYYCDTYLAHPRPNAIESERVSHVVDKQDALYVSDR